MEGLGYCRKIISPHWHFPSQSYGSEVIDFRDVHHGILRGIAYSSHIITTFTILIAVAHQLRIRNSALSLRYRIIMLRSASFDLPADPVAFPVQRLFNSSVTLDQPVILSGPGPLPLLYIFPVQTEFPMALGP
jgi:hypothetical protein